MECETSNHSTTTTCDSTTINTITTATTDIANVTTDTVTTATDAIIVTTDPTATITNATTTTATAASDSDVTSGLSERVVEMAPNVSRVKLDEETFNLLETKDLWVKWCEQNDYIDSLEAKIDSYVNKNYAATIKELERRIKQQQADAARRENALVMRLTRKEQEVADHLNRIQAMREALIPPDSQLHSTLCDPALNIMFEAMKSEVISSKERVEQMQNELTAWKFTTDSHMGKQLMAKCQALYKENEELGKTMESGRIGKMEGELALQKSFVEEMKKSQMETDEFLFELDEEVEGLQATILHLRNQLKEVKTESDQTIHPPTELMETPKEVKTN